VSTRYVFLSLVCKGIIRINDHIIAYAHVEHVKQMRGPPAMVKVLSLITMCRISLSSLRKETWTTMTKAWGFGLIFALLGCSMALTLLTNSSCCEIVNPSDCDCNLQHVLNLQASNLDFVHHFSIFSVNLVATVQLVDGAVRTLQVCRSLNCTVIECFCLKVWMSDTVTR
jgi:hypothetical protein